MDQFAPASDVAGDRRATRSFDSSWSSLTALRRESYEIAGGGWRVVVHGSMTSPSASHSRSSDVRFDARSGFPATWSFASPATNTNNTTERGSGPDEATTGPGM